MLNFSIWALLAIMFIALEAFIPGLFFFLALSFGCIAGGLVSLYFPDPAIQASTTLLASLAFFFILKRLTEGQKLSRFEEKNSNSNIDALVGEKAVILKKIASGNVGSVKLGGETWRAKSLEQKDLEVGQIVVVIKVDGNKLMVKKLEQKHD